MPSPLYKSAVSLVAPGPREVDRSSKKSKNGVRRRVSRDDLFVAARIRSIRAATGTTQQELSAALNISHQQLNKYERGRNRISAGHLLAISHALGVPVARLLGEEGEAPPIEQATETVSLIRDFRLLDPKLRRAVRTLVRALAG